VVLTGAERFDPRVNRRTRVLRRRAPRSCATAIECEPLRGQVGTEPAQVTGLEAANSQTAALRRGVSDYSG
jgi:hypothetical protein